MALCQIVSLCSRLAVLFCCQNQFSRILNSVLQKKKKKNQHLYLGRVTAADAKSSHEFRFYLISTLTMDVVRVSLLGGGFSPCNCLRIWSITKGHFNKFMRLELHIQPSRCYPSLVSSSQPSNNCSLSKRDLLKSGLINMKWH